MQAYHPSSAAHSHLNISTISITNMQAYHPSTAAHSLANPTSTQAYYPSTAAHTHLNMSNIPTASTPPPTPTAAELIASLQNPENLSDDELFKRTLTAQSTLQKWQDEYLTNDAAIQRQTTGLVPKDRLPKALQLQDPTQYERQRAEAEAAFTAQTTTTTSSRGRIITKTANAYHPKPSAPPAPKTRKPKKPTVKAPAPPKPTIASSSKPKKPTTAGPKPSAPTIAPAPAPSAQPQISIPKELQIDMNGPQPAQVVGKRTRQPRKLFDAEPTPALSAANPRAATPSLPKKRARAPSKSEDAAPPAKKRAKSATPAPKREETPGPARSKGEVMKEVWARRKAEGRNGRHGGPPKAATVAKAEKGKGK